MFVASFVTYVGLYVVLFAVSVAMFVPEFEPSDAKFQFVVLLAPKMMSGEYSKPAIVAAPLSTLPTWLACPLESPHEDVSGLLIQVVACVAAVVPESALANKFL